MPESRDGKIDYIEFTAPDLAAVKAFYTGAFGWTFTDYGPDYTAFSASGVAGGFAKVASAAKPTYPLIVLYASTLSVTREKIVRAGGRIDGELEHFPGGCRNYFFDPAGHRLAVWSETDR